MSEKSKENRDFFDEIPQRRGTHSIKWDMNPNDQLLPMWVADMDFKTAPAIIKAIEERVAHGVFGYTLVSDEFYEAIIFWWKKRHHLHLSQSSIIPVAGILPALSAIIRALTAPEDQILLLTPVYDHFFSTILECGRKLILSDLLCDQNRYSIDFDDLEKKAAQPLTRLILLSNPHNPTGRVWTRDELYQLVNICVKHKVYIVSDEIHADLVHQPFVHCPVASVNSSFHNLITCCSPSKSFNLAGIQVGYIFSDNEKILRAIEKVFLRQDTVLLNVFAAPALIAAYCESEPWLEALKSYIYQNYLLLIEFLNQHLPFIQVTPLQSTYLVWLDIRETHILCEELTESLKEKQNLWLNPGTMYGKSGEGFLRMNIGCPRELLEDGLKKLHQFFLTQI